MKENYFEGELKESADGFETTKKDKAHHGFGLKSIRMITENYHGNMSVTGLEEWGNLIINILIPLVTPLKEGKIVSKVGACRSQGMILGAHSRLDKIFGDVFEVYAIKNTRLRNKSRN